MILFFSASAVYEDLNVIMLCLSAPAMPEDLNVTATSTSTLLATWEAGNNSLQVTTDLEQ